jgi:hypothetical protein
MTVGFDSKTVVRGLGIISGALAASAIYAWLVWVPLRPSGRTGQQIFLLILSPIVVGWCLYCIYRGLNRIWTGLTRFDLAPGKLVIRSPLRTRILPWGSVQDFFLPPARFPKPPQELLLLLRNGQSVRLPLSTFRAAGVQEMLKANLPGLAEWGLERVRTCEPTTLSPLRVRWNLHRQNLIPLFITSILLLMTVLAVLMESWDLFNYVRIRRSHESAPAEIVEIEKRGSEKDETAWARVRYTVPDGRVFRLHRKVAFDFLTRFKVGERVTVEYLPAHPGIARIKDWDLDGRQWIMLILFVPLAWFLYRVFKRMLAQWFRPLRAQIGWAADPSLPHITFAPAHLQTLAALLPERHAGSFFLKPPPASSRKPGIIAWARTLRKAGLDSQKVLDRWLVLSADQAARMLARLGGSNSYDQGYAVADCPNPDEIEKVFLGWADKSRIWVDPAVPEPVRFYFLNKMIGPLDANERHALFEAWINWNLRRLYGGKLPDDIPATDFAHLLRIDPASGIFELLIERRSFGPRIWLRDHEQLYAQMAECTRGRWLLADPLPIPRILKHRGIKRPVIPLHTRILRRETGAEIRG